MSRANPQSENMLLEGVYRERASFRVYKDNMLELAICIEHQTQDASSWNALLATFLFCRRDLKRSLNAIHITTIAHFIVIVIGA